MVTLKNALFAIALMTAIAGCATTTTTTFPTGNANKEQVWVGCLDAVSNFMHVNSADEEKGLIEARSDGLFERSLARVEIRERAGQFDVTLGVYLESTTVLTRPSGLRAAEDSRITGVNTDLRDTLATEIKKRLEPAASVSTRPPAKPAAKPAARPSSKAGAAPPTARVETAKPTPTQAGPKASTKKP